MSTLLYEYRMAPSCGTLVFVLGEVEGRGGGEGEEWVPRDGPLVAEDIGPRSGAVHGRPCVERKRAWRRGERGGESQF